MARRTALAAALGLSGCSAVAGEYDVTEFTEAAVEDSFEAVSPETYDPVFSLVESGMEDGHLDEVVLAWCGSGALGLLDCDEFEDRIWHVYGDHEGFFGRYELDVSASSDTRYCSVSVLTLVLTVDEATATYDAVSQWGLVPFETAWETCAWAEDSVDEDSIPWSSEARLVGKRR